jgi:hypothetical protein
LNLSRRACSSFDGGVELSGEAMAVGELGRQEDT